MRQKISKLFPVELTIGFWDTSNREGSYLLTRQIIWKKPFSEIWFTTDRIEQIDFFSSIPNFAFPLHYSSTLNFLSDLSVSLLQISIKRKLAFSNSNSQSPHYTLLSDFWNFAPSLRSRTYWKRKRRRRKKEIITRDAHGDRNRGREGGRKNGEQATSGQKKRKKRRG